MASRVSVTESELLDALAEAGPRPAPAHAHALTAAELRERLGLKRDTLKKRLRELNAAGRLETWIVQRTDVGGRPVGVPAYTIKPAPKRKR